jgi:putative membrane protein
LNFCIIAWGLSLWAYEKATPYREWSLIEQGNKAAAMSMGGAALGLALPLCALAAHSGGWVEMASWSALSLACQLGLWLVFSRLVFKHLRESIEKGVESVGLFLGAGSVALGAMVAACVS